MRLTWIVTVFARYHSFPVLMACFPVSLIVTTILLAIAVLIYHPSKPAPSKVQSV